MYSSERKPVAESNTELSVHNYYKSAKAAALLGVDPSLARAVVDACRLPVVPTFLRGIAVKQALNFGLSFLKMVKIPGSFIGDMRVKALKDFVARGESLPLIFPGDDLGFSYGSKNQSRDLNEITIGCRVPHRWFALRNDEGNPATSANKIIAVSSLDIPSLINGIHEPHIIVITPEEHFEDWNAIIRTSGCASVRLVVVGSPKKEINHDSLQEQLQCPRHETDFAKVVSASPYISLHEIQRDSVTCLSRNVLYLMDLTGLWLSNNHRSVLLRPDGHVAGVIDDKVDSKKETFYKILQETFHIHMK